MFVFVFIMNGIVFGNPIEDKWNNEEQKYSLEIENDDELTIKGNFDGQDMGFDLNYSLNKADKLITIKVGTEEYGMFQES